MMIRVLVLDPLPDDQIPEKTKSVNWVIYEGSNRMALYYDFLPLPSSLEKVNILNIYDSNNMNSVNLETE